MESELHEQAGRVDAIMFMLRVKLRLAFALDLSREACKFRLAFARGLAGQRSQSCRGTVIVVVFVVTTAVRVRVLFRCCCCCCCNCSCNYSCMRKCCSVVVTTAVCV